MADKEKEIVLAEADTVVDTLKKHVSFDGIFREPGGKMSRYTIPAGKQIPKHVIVINETKTEADPSKKSSGEAKKVDFKKLTEAEQLEAIKACDDAEKLTDWGVNLEKDSKVLKAITDRIAEIELGGQNS